MFRYIFPRSCIFLLSLIVPKPQKFNMKYRKTPFEARQYIPGLLRSLWRCDAYSCLFLFEILEKIMYGYKKKSSYNIMNAVTKFLSTNKASVAIYSPLSRLDLNGLKDIISLFLSGVSNCSCTYSIDLNLLDYVFIILNT